MRHYPNEVAFDSRDTMSTILYHLQADSNVARLRDENGADLVHFIRDNFESGVAFMCNDYYKRTKGFATSQTNLAAESGD